ncbi:MAG TPA: hypothetical protein VHV27_04420, partial [Phenylobacterium sp.]|nr:hypothetical protein [Phenylobacterium sp.]
MIRNSCLAGLCVALVALPATAQQGASAPRYLFVSPCGEPFRGDAAKPYPVATWFARADANHDGVVDQGEFRGDAKAFFAVLDVDGDGVVAGFEITRYERQIVPEILSGWQGAALDGLGEGALGGAHDGARLWLAQIPDYVPEVEGEATHLPNPTGPVPDATSMEGAAAFNLLGEPEPVTSSDQNFDGRITLAEFLTAADRRFR